MARLGAAVMKYWSKKGADIPSLTPEEWQRWQEESVNQLRRWNKVMFWTLLPAVSVLCAFLLIGGVHIVLFDIDLFSGGPADTPYGVLMIVHSVVTLGVFGKWVVDTKPHKKV